MKSKVFKMVNSTIAPDISLVPTSNRLSDRPTETLNSHRNQTSNQRYTFAVTEGNFPCHVIAELKKRGNWS